LKGAKAFDINEPDKNFGMTAFTLFIISRAWPPYPEEGTASDFYNFLQGKVWDGTDFIDPHSGTPTKYVLPGDPVNGTGWYEGEGWPDGPLPGDRRVLMSTGPFDFAPGDTQEVVIGILMSGGENNILSVAELKKDAAKLQLFYDNYKPEVPVPVIELPKYYSIGQNYPNPFNPVTTIKYTLPVRSLVTLKVYDILGKEVATLVNIEQEPDEYSVEFNAENLSSGIYFYTITAREFTKTVKMILMK